MPGPLSLEDELRRMLRQDPFHPFVLKLTSGDRYEVNDPFQVAINEGYIFFVHPKKGSSYIRKNQLVAIDAAEPTT